MGMHAATVRASFTQTLMLCLSVLAAGCGERSAPSASFAVAAQGLYTASVSDNGQFALVGSLNHGASLWDIQENARLFNWSHAAGEPVELVAADFSPDSSRAVTTDPRTLVMWDTQTGASLAYWATPGAVLSVSMLGDNRRVLMGLDNHSGLLFDAVTGDYLFTFLHEGEVGSVATDQVGKYALTGSDDYSAILWNLVDGSRRHTYAHDNPVRTVALSADGRLAFTAAQGDLVAVWDNDSGEMIHQLHNGPNHGVLSARFSDDGSLLAVGYANRRVMLYDLASGRNLRTWDPGTRHQMRATGAAILALGFSQNQRSVYALTGDGRLLRLSRS